MYLFELNMSNIKSEALLQNSLKSNCVQESFYNKVQATWKSQTFRFTFYSARVFSSEICEFLRTPFENTNNSVEHLRLCKVLFVNR